MGRGGALFLEVMGFSRAVTPARGHLGSQAWTLGGSLGLPLDVSSA